MAADMIIDRDGTKRPVPIHGPEAFAAMRKAGRLAAEVLDFVTPHVRRRLDRPPRPADRRVHARHGGAGDAGLPRLPKLVHLGQPRRQPRHPERGQAAARGDIANIDVTVVLEGWHDTSRMFLVGDRLPVKALRLVDVTFEAMWAGIRAVRPGNTLGDVGHAIQAVAEARFSVVRDFVGHGLGLFRRSPEVKHYGRPGDELVLRPGMLFTIEPMINAGRPEVKILATAGPR